MTLAGDDAGLLRLRERYGRFTDTAPNPDALRVALAGLNGVPGPALLNAVTDGDTFAAWVVRMKARFRETPAAPAAASAPARQQAQAPAPAPKQG
jgi:hypothetical protein